MKVSAYTVCEGNTQYQHVNYSFTVLAPMAGCETVHHCGTSLIGSKPYQHFFSEKHRTGTYYVTGPVQISQRMHGDLKTCSRTVTESSHGANSVPQTPKLDLRKISTALLPFTFSFFISHPFTFLPLPSLFVPFLSRMDLEEGPPGRKFRHA